MHVRKLCRATHWQLHNSGACVTQLSIIIFSSHLGLIVCLAVVVRVNTQRHIQSLTEKLGDILQKHPAKRTVECF